MRDLSPAGGTPRQIADAVNGLIRGRSRAVVPITLAPGATETIVTAATAPNIAEGAYVFLAPVTANAAAALATTFAVVERVSGVLRIRVTHANAASTDRTFAAGIFGGG